MYVIKLNNNNLGGGGERLVKVAQRNIKLKSNCGKTRNVYDHLSCDSKLNATLSLGDTVISLHTLPTATLFCLNLILWAGGGGEYSWVVKTRSARSGQFFIFGGGWGWLAKNRVFLAKRSKNSGNPACLCITDSL